VALLFPAAAETRTVGLSLYIIIFGIVTGNGAKMYQKAYMMTVNYLHWKHSVHKRVFLYSQKKRAKTC